MAFHCIQCGSSRVHKSRLRPGERTPANLLLSPYRCRDCKARFWHRNNDAYLVTIVGIGSMFLLGALVWIEFSPSGSAEKDLPQQLQTALPSPLPDSKSSSTKLAVAETTGFERKNALPTIQNESASALPKPDDNRFYTTTLFLDKAKQGNADAQYQLGLLYLAGKGTLQDFSEASKWFILAAEQHHPLAQYELGLLYQFGQGVEMDNEKSYMWFNLAAAAGVEQAIGARDKTMRSLSRDQLASAQKAAREWLNSKNKPGK